MSRKNHISRFFTRALYTFLILCLLMGALPMTPPIRAQGPAPHIASGPSVSSRPEPVWNLKARLGEAPTGATGTPEVLGPGWHLVSAHAVSPEAARELLFGQQAMRQDLGARSRITELPASETEATPEIQALARALQNDPKLIFDYVHNHIDYIPTFGSANGATGTLLAGRGNDWDQTSLFIALMRASGYTADYVWGEVVYSVDRLANWVGVENNIDVVAAVFALGGVPIAEAPGGLVLIRVWAQAIIDGQTYIFDPAMKEYREIAGIDLATATGYDRAAFMARAQEGATVTDSYTMDMNEANVRSDLATYSMNLVNYIRDNMPDANVAQVIGGREIIATRMITYPTSLPYALSVSNETVFTTIPDALRHVMQIQHRGIDYIFRTFEIASRRVSIFYREEDHAPVLSVDGVPVATGWPTSVGATHPLIITVDHPYAGNDGTFADQQGVMFLEGGSSYVIVHSLNAVSPRLIGWRNQLLTQYLRDGFADTSESLLGETLWVMGLTWLHEAALFRELVDRVGEMVFLNHHTVGIMGQNEGYFIDMPMGMVSIVPRDGVSDVWPAFRTQAMMASAFEHGVLEQLQGSDKPAASAIKMLHINNHNGQKTFLAHSGNWAAVRPQLRNYTASTLADIAEDIAAGYEFVLPEDAHITLEQWRGLGYIRHIQVGMWSQLGLIISGGYYGGYSAKKGQVDSEKVREETEKSNQPPDKKKEVHTPKDSDPVDMSTGAAHHTHVDLTAESEDLPGLRFIRTYNSGDHYNLGPLGYGWNHNYNLFLSPHSDGGPGLGLRQPTDAASLIVAAYVTLDMMTFPLPIQKWVTAVLVIKWGMDQLLDNAITVHMGPTILQYTRLADGTYNPPPGIRRELIKQEPYYYLQGEANDYWVFDAQGTVQAWQDANGNDLTFTYDANDRLQSVSTSTGVTFTFTYSGSLITSVTDQGGRSVSFEYTGDELTGYRDAEGHVWRYGYDAAHRLTSVTRPRGNTVFTNTYDTQGRVLTQTDALNNTTTFYFGGFRNALTDPNGYQTVYYFDDAGRLIERVDPLGQRFRLAYDHQGRLVSATNRLGDTTTYTYYPESGQVATITNNLGQVTTLTYTAQTYTFTNPISPAHTVAFTFYNLSRIDYPDGAYEAFTYDARGNPVAYTNNANHMWQVTYNERGQPLTILNPAGGVITYTYHADGTMASRADSDTGTTTYSYDQYKRLTRITHPDGASVQFAYDLNDRITSLTDENGHTYTFEYDANGNLVRATDPLGHSSQYSYDAMDQLVQETNRLGATTTYTYDALNRLASVTDATGVTTRFSYDPAGRPSQTSTGDMSWTYYYDAEGVLTAITAPSGRTTGYQVDRMGRLVGVVDPLNRRVTLDRDTRGRVTTVTDPLNRSQGLAYDGEGLLAGVTVPLVGPATYRRDPLGRLTRLTDLNGKSWQFTYTPMGRLRTHTDPLGRTWQFVYDDVRGRLAQIIYPDGTVLTHSYDAAGNITRLHYSNGPDLRFTYDALGRLVGANHLQLERDAEGNVTSSRDGDVAFGATYDGAERLKTVSYNNSAFTVTYTYDQATGLLVKVQDSLTGAWVRFTYDADARLTGIARSNGMDTTLTWDDGDRIIRLQDGDFMDLRYSLDAAGQVTQVQMLTPLDPFVGLETQVTELTYDDAGQVSSTGYVYDQRGRLIAAPGHTYSWDGASRLVAVDEVTLGYNGVGDVITRTEGGVTTHYYYNYAIDMAPIVAERDENTGQFLRYYVWTPEGELLYMIDATQGNKVYFYHFDRIGSTLALTDEVGTVTDAYAYDPFGRLLAHQGDSPQPFTFVGRWGVRQEGRDGTLYHMRARYYDAVTQRFLSRDPVWPQPLDPLQLNPYQYAVNSPLAAIDPTGTFLGSFLSRFVLRPLLFPGEQEGSRKDPNPILSIASKFMKLYYFTGESWFARTTGLTALLQKFVVVPLFQRLYPGPHFIKVRVAPHFLKGKPPVPRSSSRIILSKNAGKAVRVVNTASKIATGATLIGGAVGWYEFIDWLFFTTPAENSKRAAQYRRSWDPFTLVSAWVGKKIADWWYAEEERRLRMPLKEREALEQREKEERKRIQQMESRRTWSEWDEINTCF